MDYYNVEKPTVLSKYPWAYRSWCCLEGEDGEELHIFVFSEPVTYFVAFREAKSTFIYDKSIYPIHGNWRYFYDTVHCMPLCVEVHFVGLCTRDENWLKRYRRSPMSLDCNIAHLRDHCNTQDTDVLESLRQLRAAGEIEPLHDPDWTDCDD